MVHVHTQKPNEPSLGAGAHASRSGPHPNQFWTKEYYVGGLSPKFHVTSLLSFAIFTNIDTMGVVGHGHSTAAHGQKTPVPGQRACFPSEEVYR
jgi:hypothetical protein